MDANQNLDAFSDGDILLSNYFSQFNPSASVDPLENFIHKYLDTDSDYVDINWSPDHSSNNWNNSSGNWSSSGQSLNSSINSSTFTSSFREQEIFSDIDLSDDLNNSTSSIGSINFNYNQTPTYSPSSGSCPSSCGQQSTNPVSSTSSYVKKSRKGIKKSFPCPFNCGSIYTRNSHLKVHVRKHTGEKPFICTYQGCDWRFRRSDELSRHKRCHSGLKPYTCLICSKNFARSDHLSKHSKIHEKQYFDSQINYVQKLINSQ